MEIKKWDCGMIDQRYPMGRMLRHFGIGTALYFLLREGRVRVPDPHGSDPLSESRTPGDGLSTGGGMRRCDGTDISSHTEIAFPIITDLYTDCKEQYSENMEKDGKIGKRERKIGNYDKFFF